MIDLQSWRLLIIRSGNQLRIIGRLIGICGQWDQVLNFHRYWIEAAGRNDIAGKGHRHDLAAGKCGARGWVVNRPV